ncbi:MAG: T9SS type A sorting domain-containing protein [Putridiphycobacter sp.]|nr:T9SS type A sorting domain-containing protein [Putridiphycobacter sp.]
MRKILLPLTIFTSLFSIGQTVSEQVSIQPGYTNQAYYSIQNGEISNISNNDWDLAFEIGSFGTGVRINGTLDWSVYVASTDTTTWATTDTTGLSTWTPLHNSDISWGEGAFNKDYDPNNQFDIGWGIYNPTTHKITGNRIFVLKASDGTVKKLWIKSMNNGTFKVLIDDLANANLTTLEIVKGDYAGKNFVYYNISNNTILDREPLASDWDFVFTKYMSEIAPNTFYPVTGVLINPSVDIYEASGADATDLTFDSSVPFSTEINTIGSDWKSYSFALNDYVIQDSLAFFIQPASGDVYKLVMTDFGGSSNGIFEFDLTQIGTASISEPTLEKDFSIYPNPAVNEIFIAGAENLISMQIFNLAGKAILQIRAEGSDIIQINTQALSTGTYIVQAIDKNGRSTMSKFVKL